MMDDFEERNRQHIDRMAADEDLRHISKVWVEASSAYEYTHHFTWLGLPIIQLPQDIIALQEVIWNVQPDLIIETGIARGGSLIFSASLLQLIGGDGLVLGVDIDIREHNRSAIQAHPLAHRIKMIEGSSIDRNVADQVAKLAAGRNRVLVLLDSNHTHDHVLQELYLYAHLVTKGSYLVVQDTIVEDLPAGFFPDRSWGPGDNPATAVDAFLTQTDRFEVDTAYDRKLLLSTAPGGYLRCIKD